MISSDDSNFDIDSNLDIDPNLIQIRLIRIEALKYNKSFFYHQLRIVTDDKRITYYILNPKELRECLQYSIIFNTSIFAAFVSLFIGPVRFGMLAAIGGLATPYVLSLMGGCLGLILGIVFGVIFSVVCIVALVRALGWSAEWVLDTLRHRV